MVKATAMSYDVVIQRIESLADPAAVAGMARYGIAVKHAYGVSIPNLRALAKEIGRDHELARQLWAKESRETRILASMIDDWRQVDEGQLEGWVSDFADWEVCDQCCMNLIEKTPYAWEKAVAWSAREEEYVKRAGFVMMARLAVGDKKAKDEQFLPFLPIIAREAADRRNFVKKAVNWALRQIGKRNRVLNAQAIAAARGIQQTASPVAKWVAADALRELTSEAVQKRLA